MNVLPPAPFASGFTISGTSRAEWGASLFSFASGFAASGAPRNAWGVPPDAEKSPRSAKISPPAVNDSPRSASGAPPAVKVSGFGVWGAPRTARVAPRAAKASRSGANDAPQTKWGGSFSAKNPSFWLKTGVGTAKDAKPGRPLIPAFSPTGEKVPAGRMRGPRDIRTDDAYFAVDRFFPFQNGLSVNQ